MKYDPDRRRRLPMIVGAVILALSSAAGGLVMQAHDQRETLIAADRGKAHGIETYRVWQNGGGLRPDSKDPKQPTTTQTHATLLSATGQTLGTMRLTMHWRKEHDPALKANKFFIRAKEYELTWLQETFATTFDGDHITIAFNGTEVYNGPLAAATADQTQAIVGPHLPLLQIGGAIEADLTKHYQSVARDVSQCCGMEPGDIVCSGGQYWREGYALQRSEACEKAVTAVQYACWNAYCIGCCAVSDCNALCFPDSDFFCIGKVKGTACRCSKFLV